jgi:hypothetical protein
MGINPKGLGLLLRSRQLHPVFTALDGDKCPFVALPFAVVGRLLPEETATLALASDNPLIFRTLIGSLLLDLALLSSRLGSDSSSSTPSSICAGALMRFFADERVTGPKYPSWAPSRLSEGVGEGEITLGVAGIWYCDMV